MLVQMRTYKGKGLVNSVVDKLPFELHLPGYNYCGPGRHLEELLKKGVTAKTSLTNIVKTTISLILNLLKSRKISKIDTEQM